MPTFVFTDPSGKKHTVTGPKGSTAAEAFEVLQKSLGGTSQMGGAAPGGDPAVERERQRKADKELYDPTSGMSWGEKALANVGAGMDTAWQGAKQLVGGGPSDDDLAEKRRIDAHLADKTTGGGALQLAGEVAPSIPLGMGAGAAAARGPALIRALAANPIMSAAGGGAASGAMMPVTSDESRLANMGMGAAGGAVAAYGVPRLIKATQAAGRGAADIGQRALAGAADIPMLGGLAARAAEGQGTKKAGRLLKESLPGGMPAIQYPGAPGLKGPTAAMATQDPALAALERANRGVAGEHWMPHDEAAGTARWNTLDKGLMDEGDLAAAKARSNQVGASVDQLYPNIAHDPFHVAMDDFYEKLQTAKNTPQYHGNPSVKAAVDYVENTMKQAGEVTPELLHTMRRTVASGLQGVPGVGDAATRAASSEPFVLSIAKQMDEVLDASSGGAFSHWKGSYSTARTAEDAAKADVNIRAKFIDPATGTPLKPLTGLDGVPDLKPHALRQAVKMAGSSTRGVNKGKNLLSPKSQQTLETIADDLEAQAIIQRSKAASTGGSGSDTASNIGQMIALEHMLPGSGVLRYALGQGGAKGKEAMQRQLAELLQDPAKLAAFIRSQEQQRLLRSKLADVPLLGQAGAGAVMMGAGAGQ